MGRSELGSFMRSFKEMASGGWEDGWVPRGAGESHRGFVQAGQHRDAGSKLVS